jgi:hypothetical protein
MEDDTVYVRTVLVPKAYDIHRCESVGAVHRRVALGGSIIGIGLGLSMLALFTSRLTDGDTLMSIAMLLLGALGVNFFIAGVYFYRALTWLSEIFEIVDERSDNFTVLDTEELRILFKDLNAELSKIVKHGHGRQAVRLLLEIAERLSMGADASEPISRFHTLARD